MTPTDDSAPQRIGDPHALRAANRTLQIALEIGGWNFDMSAAPRSEDKVIPIEVWRPSAWPEDRFIVHWDEGCWHVHDGKNNHPLRGKDPVCWRYPPALPQSDR